jgi:predicted small secreted protein
MKKSSIIVLLTLITLSLTSCEVIGGIFKAGVWSGIIIVVVVVALLLWLLAKMFGGRKS